MYHDTTTTPPPDAAKLNWPTSFRRRDLNNTAGALAEREEFHATLEKLVEGLSKLLADEMTQIKENPAADLETFANAKAVYMLELSRMMRRGQFLPLSEHSRDLILMLRNRLSENQEALRIYLEASRSVAETIKRAIRDAESDGTYRYGTSAGGRDF